VSNGTATLALPIIIIPTNSPTFLLTEAAAMLDWGKLNCKATPAEFEAHPA
jgi:hypothetical protein